MTDELLDKWRDALEHADDFYEKALIQEFLDDLRKLRNYVN